MPDQTCIYYPDNEQQGYLPALDYPSLVIYIDHYRGLDMKQYNIAEAKSHFSELIKLALQGEEIVIARDNKPLLKLAPVKDVRKKRRPGTAKRHIRFIAPDFDDIPADFKDYR